MSRFMVSGLAAFDPRFALAGNAAVGMWVRAGSWASKCGPAVPDAVLLRLGTRRERQMLEAAGLIQRAEEGVWYLAGLPIWRSYRDDDGRPAIPLAVRLAVYDRDGYRCRACGTDEELTIDHIYPWSKGGTDHPSNFQTLCRSCNSKKGARLEWVYQ